MTTPSHYCSVNGEICTKSIKVNPGTIFIAEPYAPKENRIRREKAIRHAVKEQGNHFTLVILDEEVKPISLTCQLCEKIQACEYGIVDITDRIPNVMMELGLLYGFGKPVIILDKRGDPNGPPSDIAGIRLIKYEEHIDMTDELVKAFNNLPKLPVVEEQSPLEGVVRVIEGKDLVTADKVREIVKAEMDSGIKEFKNAIKEAGLTGAIKNTKEEKETPKDLKKVLARVEELEKIVDTPLDPMTYFYKGNAYFEEKQYDKAAENYNKVIEINPKNIDAWFNKGATLGKQEKYEEALQCYDKALEINSQDAETWSAKGAALSYLDKHEEALQCFDKALEIDPKFANAWYNKSCTYSLMGEIENALKNLSKAIELSKEYSILAKTDKDFDNIRSDPRFIVFLEKT